MDILVVSSFAQRTKKNKKSKTHVTRLTRSSVTLSENRRSAIARFSPRIFVVGVSLIHGPRRRVNTRHGIKARVNDLSWSSPTLLTPRSPRIIPRLCTFPLCFFYSHLVLSFLYPPPPPLLSSFARITLLGAAPLYARNTRYQISRGIPLARDNNTRKLNHLISPPFSIRSFALLKSRCLVNCFQLSSRRARDRPHRHFGHLAIRSFENNKLA